MTFIPFEPWHLDLIRLSDSVRDILGKYPSGEIIKRLSGAGLAYTIVVVNEDGDTTIIGVGGACPIKDGRTAEVFVVAAEDRKVHRVAFVKAVRQILDHARARFAIIEAVGAEGVPSRWFTWLGFEAVGDRWRLAGEGAF